MRAVGRGVSGGGGRKPSAEGDAEHGQACAVPPGVTHRRDSDGAGRAVEQAFGDTPGEDPAHRATVAGADDDQVGPLALGQLVQAVRGRGRSHDLDPDVGQVEALAHRLKCLFTLSRTTSSMIARYWAWPTLSGGHRAQARG